MLRILDTRIMKTYSLPQLASRGRGGGGRRLEPLVIAFSELKNPQILMKLKARKIFIGKNLLIAKGVKLILEGENISIGHNVRIGLASAKYPEVYMKGNITLGNGVKIEGKGQVVIDDNVKILKGATLKGAGYLHIDMGMRIGKNARVLSDVPVTFVRVNVEDNETLRWR